MPLAVTRMKPFPEIIQFARQEHQRFLKDVLASDSEQDYPLAHIFLFDAENAVTMFALAVHTDPKLNEFLRNLRAMVQTKILYEGFQAAVYCGIVMQSPPLTPEMARIMSDRRKANPAGFLDDMAREHGIINREYVMVTAENGTDTFVLSQQFHAKKLPRPAPTKKQRKQGKEPPQPIAVVLEGDPLEALNQKLPNLPHCGFYWPKQTTPKDSQTHAHA